MAVIVIVIEDDGGTISQAIDRSLDGRTDGASARVALRSTLMTGGRAWMPDRAAAPFHPLPSGMLCFCDTRQSREKRLITRRSRLRFRRLGCLMK